MDFCNSLPLESEVFTIKTSEIADIPGRFTFQAWIIYLKFMFAARQLFLNYLYDRITIFNFEVYPLDSFAIK